MQKDMADANFPNVVGARLLLMPVLPVVTLRKPFCLALGLALKFPRCGA